MKSRRRQWSDPILSQGKTWPVVARFNAYLGLNPEVKFLQISDLFSQITQWTVTDSESSEFTTRKVRHKTLVRWNQLVFKGLVDCFFSRVWSRELRHSHNHRSHWGTKEHRELEIRRLLSRDDSCLIRSIRISEQLFPNKKNLNKKMISQLYLYAKYS